MNRRTPIVNISGDEPETQIQLGERLGANELRRKIFNAVYGRGTRPKSLKQIMAAAEIPYDKKQYVQNQLNYLSLHHLIVKSKNDGSVKDGSRYLYEKDDTVKAHKAKILKYADDRKAAEAVPTKRQPIVRRAPPVNRATRSELKRRKPLDVLFLTANPNPKTSTSLRVDAEYRMVSEAIRSSIYRDHITLHHIPAADLKSLTQGLNDHRPQIVHFSGHGNEDGIETDLGTLNSKNARPLSFQLLGKALDATDTPPDVVVLNSCNSAAAKKYLLPNTKVIIGMKESISDKAAANFAKNFYAAIASGQSVKVAFNQAKIFVENDYFSEADTPVLDCAKGVRPANIVLT